VQAAFLLALGGFVIAVLVILSPFGAIGYGGYRFAKWFDLKHRTDNVKEIAHTSDGIRQRFARQLEGTNAPQQAKRDAIDYVSTLHAAATNELNRVLSHDLRRKDAPHKLKKEWLREYEQEARAIATITDRIMDQMRVILTRSYAPAPPGIYYPEQHYHDPAKAMKEAVAGLISNSGSEDVSKMYDQLISPEVMCRACHFDGRLGANALQLHQDVRFEHQWVIAPSGTGKTTLLQTQIVEDLERVRRGECSIIVIDSQNQLIPKIARLKLFAPGEPLHGKLIVIEPDPDYPPALNVLDIGLADLGTRDRYRLQAEALENIKSCLATMADTQDDMLSYIVELCFVIPGATIQTIVDILKPNGLDAFRQHLDYVDQTCRDYFETSFTPRSQSTTVTKEALTRRLMGMLRNPTFRRMFLNERGKFNMANELATPKVILINTDLEFLRHDACQLFGRFFIAQLLQASEMRGARSLPVYCYIDECQDYIANDDNAAKLMDKVRKRKVGMIFAHQRLANIESPNVKDALANVGIRFAGGNETDAQYLSRIFRCEPDFIADKTRGTFACYVRRQTIEGAVEVYVPADALENLPQMSDVEHANMRQEMRGRFAAPAEDRRVHRATTATKPPQQDEPKPSAPPTGPTASRRTRRRNPDTSERTKPVGDWEP